MTLKGIIQRGLLKANSYPEVIENIKTVSPIISADERKDTVFCKRTETKVGLAQDLGKPKRFQTCLLSTLKAYKIRRAYLYL